MIPRRARAVTLSLAALGVCVVVACAVVFRDVAVEQWYLWKLDSHDEATRLLAAEKLGELKSVRAVPRLIELIEEEEREKVSLWASSLGHSGGIESRSGISLTPILYALYEIGPVALPAVQRAIDIERKKPLELVSIRIAWQSPDREVRKQGYE